MPIKPQHVQIKFVNITPSTQLIRNNDITFTEVDEEIVMFNVAKGEYYGMDPIASTIWKLLEAPISVKQLCANLAQHYQASMDDIEQDTISFLQQLARSGLIRLS